MEQPLIVLIDPEVRKIFLYGEYNREFLLEELHILKAFLKDRNVMYVTQATELSGDELIDIASGIVEQLPSQELPKRFYRVNAEGFTTIPELRLRFSGPKDCKPVEQFGDNIFEKSQTMVKLLISGKLEILTEAEVAKIRKPRPNDTLKDKQLDSILLKSKVDDFEPDNIFTEDNEIPTGENDHILTDEEEAIRQGFGKQE